MVTQIRTSVFETNSSSTHSVTIGDGEFIIPKDIKGEFTVCSGDYGWIQESYSRFFDKVSYAFTFAVNYSTEEDLDLLNETLKKNLKGVELVYEDSEGNQYYYEALVELLKNDEFPDFGYIDHQSIYKASEIFASERNLENFLFCQDSSFETDNDNH